MAELKKGDRVKIIKNTTEYVKTPNTGKILDNTGTVLEKSRDLCDDSLYRVILDGMDRDVYPDGLGFYASELELIKPKAKKKKYISDPNFNHGHWTKAEDEYLIRNKYNKTNEQIGKDLNRTMSSVQARMLTLGVVRFHRNPDWSSEDLKTLKREGKKGTSLPKLAEKFGRTQSAVQQQCLKHGYTRGASHKWTQEELNTLTEMYQNGSTFKEIGAILGRTTKSISAKRSKLGIKRGTK